MTDEQFQLAFRTRCKSKLAYVHATAPSKTKVGETVHCRFTGTIVCAEKEFLYVIVLSSVLLPTASYHVVLPDGSQFDIGPEALSEPVVEGGRLSGFYVKHQNVPYDIRQISAVEFGGDVSMFEAVYLSDFIDETLNLNTTGGQVVFPADRHFFAHSCGPTVTAENGAPLFDVDGALVGISYANFQGPTTAYNRATFEKELNKIVGSKDLEHFIGLIYMGGSTFPGRQTIRG